MIFLQAKVKLFAQLREGRCKEANIGIEDQTRVKDVVKDLNIATNEVAICLVNGQDKSLDSEIQNGDTVALFPPIGG